MIIGQYRDKNTRMRPPWNKVGYHLNCIFYGSIILWGFLANPLCLLKLFLVNLDTYESCAPPASGSAECSQRWDYEPRETWPAFCPKPLALCDCTFMGKQREQEEAKGLGWMDG